MRKPNNNFLLRAMAFLFVLAQLSADPTRAQTAQSANELAQQLSNPVASLISVPFQLNFDDGFGPGGTGSRTLLNFQPVIPISIGEDWNLISRTIVPVINQEDFIPGTSQSGIGDIVQSFFFSPKYSRTWIWLLSKFLSAFR